MKRINSKCMLLLGAFLLISVQQIQAQSMGKQTVAMMEESPAGSKILSFVKAVNKGEAVTDEFIKSIFHEELIAKAGLVRLKNIIEADMPENDGKLSLYLVERTERFRFVVHARGAKSGEWLKLDFLHKGAAPYKIESLGVDVVDNAPEGADKVMKID